ncbi:MAG TPA: hypothetical protein VIY48_09820 [Candidatus Paceibacterota bacterium]
MTDNSNPVDINTDDLDKFSDILFNKKAPEPEAEVKEEPVEEEVEQEVAEDDHSQPEEDEEVIEEEEGEAEAEADPEPQPKPKNKTQERIEKLVAEARVAERERDAERREKEFLIREMQRMQQLMQEKPEQKEPLTAKLAPGAPRPDAVNEKGEELYPLGEFDPKYIADLTKFTITQQFEEAKQAEAKAVAERQALAAQEEIKTTWSTNLEKAEEGLPDIRQKIGKMTEAFQGIDPNYGEYLAGTIMSSEYGPEIMYFLADNIGEARKIVASGPAAATRMIGRLEAQFVAATEREEQSNKQSASKAPPPPERQARGSRGSTSVRADTDDLDAFEKVFFNKKR